MTQSTALRILTGTFIAAALSSCSVTPRTAIRVDIDAEPMLLASGPIVMIRVRTYDWNSPGRSTIGTTDFRLGAGGTMIPFSLTVAPRDLSAPTQSLGIEVSGWSVSAPPASTQPVIRHRIHSGFRANELLVVSVLLQASCATMQCSDDQTCSGGVCIPAFVDSASLPRVGEGPRMDVPSATVDTPNPRLDVPNPQMPITCLNEMRQNVGYCPANTVCLPPNNFTMQPPPPLCCLPNSTGCPNCNAEFRCMMYMTPPPQNMMTNGCCVQGTR